MMFSPDIISQENNVVKYTYSIVKNRNLYLFSVSADTRKVVRIEVRNESEDPVELEVKTSIEREGGLCCVLVNQPLCHGLVYVYCEE